MKQTITYPDGLQAVLDGCFVYEQVHFSDLKPNAPFYLACPILDRGRFHVLPMYPRPNPQPADAVVWTVCNRWEWDNGVNPWVRVEREKSGRIPAAGNQAGQRRPRKILAAGETLPSPTYGHDLQVTGLIQL